jgi:hypothetical protein
MALIAPSMRLRMVARHAAFASRLFRNAILRVAALC